MAKIIKTHLCVIGAGSGGLSVSAAAAQMGAKIVLIEKGKMGGDCLNYGCIPSKSLLSVAHMNTAPKLNHIFGSTYHTPPYIDFENVHKYVHDVIAEIAPHDSVERFEELGVTVLKGTATFIDKRSVQVEDTIIQARRFVIATGSSCFIPPITGINDVHYLTNKTIFNLTQAPQHLVIIGGGAIGVEMAQAHRKLGCQVTILEKTHILPNHDVELVKLITDKMRLEGIEILEETQIKKVSNAENKMHIMIQHDTVEKIIEASHLLIATGRQPNIDKLQLEKANIHFNDKGITVDQRLRTNNKKIYAIGDVCGRMQWTHMASYQAGIVIRNALFHIPAKINDTIVPHVIYTDPEIAQLGISEKEISNQKKIRIIKLSLKNNDRACVESTTEGFIKIIVTKKGRILGVSIIGKNAGDLLSPWILAMQNNLPISAIANMVIPYPTRSEISKHVAGEFYKPLLFSKKVKFLVKCLSWFR